MTAKLSRRARFTQSDATRALNAAKRAGMTPSGYKIDPSGSIIVMLHDDTSGPNQNKKWWEGELLP